MNLLQNPNFGPLVDSKFSVLRFDNNLTQTPLFVEVILVILKKRGLANLEEFHQSIASIYKLFVKVLYERSIMGTNEYDHFYVLYRNLAYKTWESGNNLDIEEINEIFNNSPFNIHFLIENGLLVQHDKTKNDYSFIHQTIPDVLAIEALSLKNDFSLFRHSEGLRDDLQTYLKDEINNILQYANLLNVNPTIASALLDRPFFNKISRSEFNPATRMIIKSCLDYIANYPNIKTIAFENILRIFRSLSEWQGQVYQILLDEVETFPKSKDLLLILLSLQVNIINDYILHLIQLNISTKILASILGNSQYLKNIIDPYFNKITTNENDRQIILFAFEADISNQYNSYTKRYVESLSIRHDEEIQFFLNIEKIRKEVFFKEYTHREISNTRRLNEILSTVGFNEIFIPKGAYSINNKTIINSKPITIAKVPFKKIMKEDNINNALLKLQNEVVYKMWTFEQFDIAYTYFEGTIHNNFKGFLGLHGFSDIKYEAVKDNNLNKISFAYFEGNSGNSNITLANNSTGKFNQTILWRQIQVY